MIIVSGHLEIDPEGRETAMAAALEMMRETRKEEGCIQYAFFADLQNPNKFGIYEEWEDLTCLQRHFETPHMKIFQEKLGGVKVVNRQVRRHHVSESADL